MLLAIMAAGLLLAACGGDDDAQQESSPATPVSIQFSWAHTIEFVGFYAADEQGYFDDAALDVTLLNGGIDADGEYIEPVSKVLSGEATFGITDAGNILRARAEGAPIVGLATIYQISPIGLMALGDTEINQPRDLVGKRVIVESANIITPYRTFLRAVGLQPDDLIEIEKHSMGIEALLEDEADILTGFITNEAMQIEHVTGGVSILPLSDYGVETYVNVIFTTEDRITNEPALIENFLRATLDGYSWSVRNPDAAAQLVVDRYGEAMVDDVMRAVQEPGMQMQLPLLRPAGKQPGMMEARVWEFTHEMMLAQDILSAPQDVSRAYTLDFLNAIYE